MYFAELRSRFARVQALSYQYVYFASSGAVACVSAWLRLLHNICCSCAIAKSFSAQLDFQTGGALHNVTLVQQQQPQHDVASDVTYWDVTAGVFVCVVTVYVYVAWSRSLLSSELTSRVTLVIAAVLVLFLSGASIPHLKFSLWRHATVDGFRVRASAARVVDKRLV